MDLFEGPLGVIFAGWVFCSVVVGVGSMLHLHGGGVKGNPRDNLLVIAAGPLTLLIVLAVAIYLAVEHYRDPDHEA